MEGRGPEQPVADPSSWRGGSPQSRQMLDVLPAAAYTCDTAGLITYFNRHAEALWGRAPKLNDPEDRFCGSFRLFSPGGTPIAHEECWMAVALKTGEPCIGQEIVIEREDGSRLSALAHASPLRDETGAVIGAVNVLVDISDRRRADETASKLAAIVDSSTDAIVSKTLEGQITSWNTAAERLFGYTAAEAIGQPITMLIPAERQDEEQYILDRIRQGERVEHFETVRTRKDGRRVDISVTISPVRDGAGRIIGASKVARDITAQKQAAAALSESEQRFTQFMKHLPGLAWIKDLSGRYVFVNDAAANAFGKNRDELYGKRDSEIFSAATAQQFRANDVKALHSDAGIETVELLAHENGIHHSIVSKFPITGPDGEAAMVGGVAIDITERMQAEEALVGVKDELAQQLADLRRLHEMSVRLSTTVELQPILEESLRTAAAFEGVDLGLLSLCDPESNELRVGASLGFDETVLKSLDRVPPGGGACGTSIVEGRRVVVEDVETDPLFEPYRRVARRAGFRAVHSTPLIARSGKTVGVLSLHFRQPHRPTDRTMHLIDLCARQAVDLIENSRLYSQLVEADRRKDEFLATLAHELRNPLAPICNSLHLLRLSDDLPPAVQHIREIMDRQVKHMVRLVDDLLEVSRIAQGKIELRKERVELSGVIVSALEISRPMIDAAGQQLAVSLPSETVVLEADSMRLAQVIANLLNNAAKYTPRGGQIWLTARSEQGEAIVSVRDNGCGIAAEMLPRVFEMFAQVGRQSNAKSGLGIGLALAKSLIQIHDGKIEANSAGPGLGSEFVVRLPVAVGQTPEMPTRMVERGPSAARVRRRILVVDDTESSAFVLGKLLESLGQHVISVDDSTEALALCQAHRPHIVISDIAMPLLDGYELARQLRQESYLGEVILIAMSGYDQASNRQRALEAGFDHYLVKPISLDELESLLGSLPPLPNSEVVLLGPPA